MRISFVRPLPHERYGTLEWVPSLEFPNGKPECFAMASRSSSVCTLADTKSRVSEWDGLLATIWCACLPHRNGSVQRRAGKRRARLSIGAPPRRRRVLDARFRGHDNRGSFSIIPAERAQRSESRNPVNAGLSGRRPSRSRCAPDACLRGRDRRFLEKKPQGAASDGHQDRRVN
jgi:hypothetical protein